MLRATASRLSRTMLVRACAPAVLRRSTAPLATHGLCASSSALTFARRHQSLSNNAFSELEDEQNRSDKVAEPAIPQGWTIQRPPNASVFTMTKSFSGESLELKFGLPAPKTGGAAAGGSEANNVESMTLTITKGSEALRFTLSVEEQELILENVAHYTDAAVAKDDTIGGEKKRAKLYNGPVISELDATFVDSFVGYLEERGVNDELAVFVTEYIFWVEQQEYENWLSAIAKFTS